jgi:hypothetical protein
MSERICWIGGNQPRHLFYINEIVKNFNVVGGIMEMREDMLPLPPDELGWLDRTNFTKHFRERKQEEDKCLGSQNPPKIPLHEVTASTLNTPETANYLKELKPDVCLVFGTKMLREPLVSALPKETINLHLGLSPRYRGAATLFWPFYNLEPNWAGATFHYIAESPDAGKIIHQLRPVLQVGDKIHKVACKTVCQATWDVQELLRIHQRHNWKTFNQKPEAGKNYLASDFKPQHLRMIYNAYNNDIVDAYFRGELICTEPKLKRQFGYETTK